MKRMCAALLIILPTVAAISAAQNSKTPGMTRPNALARTVAGPVTTITLPPIVEFVSMERLREGFSTPYLGALCRLPALIELLPADLLEPVFSSAVRDSSVAVTAKDCRDGVYRAESPPNLYGYRYVLTVDIAGGRIRSAEYDEVSREGKGKKGDAEYCREMEKSGSSPAIAYPLYEKQLIDRQDLTKMDAVSGATWSLYRFRTVAALALSAARERK